MLSSRDFSTGFRQLGVDPAYPVIVHASLSPFAEVQGGQDAVLGALLSVFETVVMPVFTYKTMVIPEVGPSDNGLVYGSGRDANRLVEMYHPGMPADKKMGTLAESLRTHPRAMHTTHPILSFAGVNARSILEAQPTHDPLLPIQRLVDEESWVLLVGVNHTFNTSLHYAEKLVGRKQFIRWALTEKGIISCWGFPGCADGFEAITPHLEGVVSTVRLGQGLIQAIPLVNLMDIACSLLKKDPLALLCGREDCLRCNAVRTSIVQGQANQPI